MKHVPGYLQLLTENGSQKRPLKNSSLFMRLGSVSGDRKKKIGKGRRLGRKERIQKSQTLMEIEAAESI